MECNQKAMDISLTLIRSIFIFLSLLASITFFATFNQEGLTLDSCMIALLAGVIFSSLLIGIDLLIKRFNLRTLNIAIIGLFLGYLLAEGILLVLSNMMEMAGFSLSYELKPLIYSVIYLTSIYIAMIMSARGAKEIYMSIPFVKFNPTSLKKKDILLDGSVLQDARIIDLAASGLLNHQIIFPRFILTELYTLYEKGDEGQKLKAKKCLEVLKKLEALPGIGLRYHNMDFPEIKNTMDKLVKLARSIDASILASEISQIQQSIIEDVLIIKFQDICCALRPLTQSGEFINIKIQRYGKEARQGVGYLEDGTMVVINGGAEYIGETIKAQVLSVKHTTSGRMIFCNALEENLLIDAANVCQTEERGMSQNKPNNYFAM